MRTNKVYSDDSYLDYFKPIEVAVPDRVEDVIQKFRALVTKERIMSVLKEHYEFEKPSDRKRRKKRESLQRIKKMQNMTNFKKKQQNQ
jgi:ribosomal protein S21